MLSELIQPRGSTIGVLEGGNSVDQHVDILTGLDGHDLVGGASYDDVRNYTGNAQTLKCLGNEQDAESAGVFVLDPTDFNSPDDNGIVLVDYLNRRWKRQFTGPVDIRWYCRFDGIADDSVGFQAALNSGYEVFIPQGVLRFTKPMNLDNFAGMSGEGGLFKSKLSILWFDSSVAGAVALKATANTFMASISGVQIKGNGNNKGTNQFAFGTDRCDLEGAITIGINFEKVHFANWSGGGALLADQWYNNFKCCYFIKCGPDTLTSFTGGIVFKDGGTASGWSGSGNIIEACYFSSAGCGIYNASCWLLVLQNCIFQNMNIPWWSSDASRNMLEFNCWYENNTTDPVSSRGGFYSAGRGRNKVPVTASDSTLSAVRVDDSGLDIYRDATEGKSHFKVTGDRGAYQVHSASPATGSGYQDIGCITMTYDAANTTYPRRGASLSTYGSYYSINAYTDAFTEKYRIAEVATAANRATAGEGAAQGAILFRTGQHKWSSTAQPASDIATRWTIDYQGQFLPFVDNVYAMGSASLRVKSIFSVTGLINTSNRDMKTEEEDIDETEKRVAQKLKGLLKKFKFKDAVKIKGEDARIHFGIIAQDVESTFAEEGLDARKYALFCYDQWWEVDGKLVSDDEIVNGNYTYIQWLDKDGVEVDPNENQDAVAHPVTKPAVQREQYGIRYEELAVFILSCL